MRTNAGPPPPQGTVGRGPLRGQVRRRGYLRVAHGVYRPVSDLDPAREHLLDLGAWRLVLPEDAAFSHVTAAGLYGWWLPKLPPFVPVFASAQTTRPRRPGLVCSRLEDRLPPRVVCGLPVEHPAEVLLRAARDLSLLDLVPMVDCALHSRSVSGDNIAVLCAGRRPGVRALRKALELADPKSESAWESRLRLFHVLAGVRVESQRELFAADGRPIGRVDLLITGTNLVQEYDGSHHEGPSQRVHDLRRDRRFAETPYVRRGYVADDLINHDVQVLQEIDRALGRRFDVRRLTRWRRYVAESTYSEAGRKRLQRRWVRLTGPPHWA